jgi:hypothetical protein
LDNRCLDSYHKSFLNQTTLNLRKEKWSFLNREFTVLSVGSFDHFLTPPPSQLPTLFMDGPLQGTQHTPAIPPPPHSCMNASEFIINFWQLMVMSPIIRMSDISLNYLVLTENTNCGCPMKHFSLEIKNLGRQIGQINSGAFGVFSAKLSSPILVQWVPCPFFSLCNQYFYKKISKIFIWDWNLNLALRDLASAFLCP